MVWQSGPYLQLSSVTLAIALNLAVYAWSRRDTAIGKAFIVLMFAIAEWSLMTVLQLCGETIGIQSIWHKFIYIGVTIVPVAWFAFVLAYTGREKYLTNRNLFLLGVIPVLTIVATFTNDIFHLMFRELVWDTRGAFPFLYGVPNLWFWAHTIYSYSLLLVSFFWLVKTFFDTSFIYRKQVGILLLGGLVPAIINIIHVLGPEIPGQIDPTPAAFAVTGLVSFWGLMRFQLLDIMPVARDTIIKDIRDGIIVVDTNNHIVDLNPAAQGITGFTANEIIGRPLDDAFPGKDRELDYLYGALLGDTEIQLGQDEQKRYYKIHTAPLYASDRLRGHLVLLYDVTEQKNQERRVQELRKEQLELRQEIIVNARDKREFMEAVAREIRTAFGDVLAGCDEITARLPADPLLPKLQTVHSGLADLDRRAQEFLEFLKMETGTLDIRPEPVELVPLLKQAAAGTAPFFRAKDCDVDVKLPESLPAVYADRERTRQVTSILLRSALGFLPPGGRAGLYAGQNGDFVWTEIRLTGVVVNAGNELFNAYDANYQEMSPGRRVSLALARRLIELSGGEVSVEGKPERGTRFCFSLPINRTPPE